MGKVARKLTTCMKGLQKYHKMHPRKSLRGYFIYGGRELTHKEVLKVVDYAVEHGYGTEADIPEKELKELLETSD